MDRKKNPELAMPDRSSFRISLYFLIAVLAIFTRLSPALADAWEARSWENLARVHLAENRLVHLAATPPKGWVIGPDPEFQVLTDFPYCSESRADFALYHHPESRSTMFLSFKPIVGQSYFGDDRIRYLSYLRKIQIGNYNYTTTVEEGSVRFFEADLAGRPYSVIRLDILTKSKEKRSIWIYLSVEEDLSNIAIFGFSAPWEESAEKARPFREFVSVVSGSKTHRIDPYEEALYCDLLKFWNPDPNPPTALHIATIEASIASLKEAVRRNPERWEARYLLASNYASSSRPTRIYRGGEEPDKAGPRLMSLPIDPVAAVAEYDLVLKANPNFDNASRWLKLRGSPPTSGQIREEMSRIAKITDNFDQLLAKLEEEILKPTSDTAKRSYVHALKDGYRSRAELRSRQGNHEAAIEDYRRMLAVHGDDHERYEVGVRIAEEQAKAGEKTEALKTYREVLGILERTDWGLKHMDEVRMRIRELEK